MLNKKAYIILSLVLIVTLLIVLAVYKSGNGQEQSSSKSSPGEVSESVAMMTSMESGGQTVSSDDISIVETQTSTAIASIKNKVSLENPDYRNVSLRFSEWYFTKENNDSNILVALSAENSQGEIVKLAFVAQLIRKDDSYTVVSIYKPDARYDIYK